MTQEGDTPLLINQGFIHAGLALLGFWGLLLVKMLLVVAGWEVAGPVFSMILTPICHSPSE